MSGRAIEMKRNMRLQTFRTRLLVTAVIVSMALGLTACGEASDESAVGPAFADGQNAGTGYRDAGDFSELDWDALIPADWDPDRLLDGLSVDGVSLDDIPDEDPRAEVIMGRLMALWQQAPVVAALDGKPVKLAGFVVPVEFGLDAMREFLLVPYYGACIHVPPPPVNQIVHVTLAEDEAYRGGVFDAVWVSGILRVERFSSEIADAGYRLEAVGVTPYP